MAGMAADPRALETIQVAIANTRYASALRDLLGRNGSWEVVCVDVPDAAHAGVLVLDSGNLERITLPIRNPERVVLIVPNDPKSLSRAWEAGINSVVFDKDPLNTAVLAVMAARLRVAKPRKTPEADLNRAGQGKAGEGHR